MDVLITIWSGVVLGAVYALVALGFTVTMVTSGVVNFAHGAIIVAGSYIAYTVLGVHRLGLGFLLLVSIVAGATMGLVCELVCIRPLRRFARMAGQQNELVTTVGFATALVGALGIRWGYVPKAVPFDGSSRPYHILGVIVRPEQGVLLLSVILAAGALHVASHHTRWGQVCLAVAEDRVAASLRGINVDRLSLYGFAAAGAVGTLSAIAIGPITYATPALANTIALGGFVALSLGGPGNFLGSLWGGLLVGVVSSLSVRYVAGNYADLPVLVLLFVTLMARPRGLSRLSAVRDV